MERAANGAERRQAEGSEVVEYRPYEDGFLQAEVRIYTRRDGGRTERGPYWYHRYHQGGKQRKIYLGRTNDPESVLKQKRAELAKRAEQRRAEEKSG
jgi:hypothetical protein